MSQLQSVKSGLSKPKVREQIPSTGQAVEMTPFKVGDEKVLLMASESKDPLHLVDSLKQVIGNCVEGVEVNDLAPFDIEYLFLRLRAISVGETSSIGVPCQHCEAQNKLDIDLTTVKIKKSDEHSSTVRVTNELAFEMKYPTLEASASITENDIDAIIKLIASSVKTVYYGEEVIEITDAELNDLIEILNDLPSADFQKVQKFFDTIPKLSHDVMFNCSECGKENNMVLEGLSNFF